MTQTSMTLRVNGADHPITIPADMLLLEVLRNRLGLIGAKLGCGTGDCGTCTVLLDGEAVNACLVYAAECVGRSVDTVEGVTSAGTGARVVEEMLNADAVQCGFCTPGVVMSACALIARSQGQALDVGQVQEGLAGNLCRCTGYLSIIAAIRRASETSW